MKAHKPRYYKTKEAISRQIDIAERRAANFSRRVAELDATIRESQLKGNGHWDRRVSTEELERAQRSLERLRRVRLPLLKSKLAEFQTIPLPGFSDLMPVVVR